MKEIEITSNAFADNGKIPVRHTGDGEDISPALSLSGISDEAESLAIIMDDIKHPLFKVYNHWLIWNIPVSREIPENIPHGEKVESLGGAVQGIGYGRHKYRGPKPPFGATHQYRYSVYVLDTRLELSPQSKKKDVMAAMDGHILQQGSITGSYK